MADSPSSGPAMTLESLLWEEGVVPLWQLGFQGDGVKVAVIDSGVAPDQFPDRIAWAIDLGEEGDPGDQIGHGTSISQAILQFAPHARIASIKVFARDGTLTRKAVLRALAVCLDRREEIRLVTISLSFRRRFLFWTSCTPERPCSLCSNVNAAVDKGLIVVAAAGNLGPGMDTVTCPGYAEKVFSVGAYERKPPKASGRVASLLKRLLPSLYQTQRAEAGTSLAAARTAGGIALLLSALPDLRREEVLAAMRATATAIGGKPHETGAGVPHWYRAYTYVRYMRAHKTFDLERAQAHHASGRELYKAGQFKESRESFAAAVECVPTSWVAHNELGLAYLQSTDLDAAAGAFSEAIKLHYVAAEPHNNLGVALARMGRLREALREYEIASQLDPDWPVPKANGEALREEMLARMKAFPGILVF